MLNEQLHTKQTPALWLMAQAAFKSTRHAELKQLNEEHFTPWRVSKKAMPIAADKLADYHKLVNWPADNTCVHPCYVHILAFELHMKLLLDHRMPFALLGLVHIKNSIHQYRPLKAGDVLDLSSYIKGLHHHKKGWSFDVVTEATLSGQQERVWKSTSTNLFRQSDKNLPIRQTRQATERSTSLPEGSWELAENSGRQYARVSGDYNLIHLHPVLAKVFGFRRHIAHGMWTKALCASALSDKFSGEAELNTHFMAPVFLPADVVFSCHQRETADKDHTSSFQLNSLNDKVHLRGTVEVFPASGF